MSEEEERERETNLKDLLTKVQNHFFFPSPLSTPFFLIHIFFHWLRGGQSATFSRLFGQSSSRKEGENVPLFSSLTLSYTFLRRLCSFRFFAFTPLSPFFLLLLPRPLYLRAKLVFLSFWFPSRKRVLLVVFLLMSFILLRRSGKHKIKTLRELGRGIRLRFKDPDRILPKQNRVLYQYRQISAY